VYVRELGYAVWGGVSGGPVGDFFNGGNGDPRTGRGILGTIGQRNVTYKKNVHCGVDVAYPRLSA